MKKARYAKGERLLHTWLLFLVGTHWKNGDGGRETKRPRFVLIEDAIGYIGAVFHRAMYKHMKDTVPEFIVKQKWFGIVTHQPIKRANHE